VVWTCKETDYSPTAGYYREMFDQLTVQGFCFLDLGQECHLLIFAARQKSDTEGVAQLVRASDCGSEGRGFEPHHPPQNSRPMAGVFVFTVHPINKRVR
jgi:hypothetical protein